LPLDRSAWDCLFCGDLGRRAGGGLIGAAWVGIVLRDHDNSFSFLFQLGSFW
jgi:hypothetical protein